MPAGRVTGEEDDPRGPLRARVCGRRAAATSCGSAPFLILRQGKAQQA
jgi:hypothetical protein